MLKSLSVLTGTDTDLLPSSRGMVKLDIDLIVTGGVMGLEKQVGCRSRTDSHSLFLMNRVYWSRTPVNGPRNVEQITDHHMNRPNSNRVFSRARKLWENIRADDRVRWRNESDK